MRGGESVERVWCLGSAGHPSVELGDRVCPRREPYGAGPGDERAVGRSLGARWQLTVVIVHRQTGSQLSQRP